MKKKFTTCAGRIALLALLCLVTPCLSAQFSGEGSGTADDPYRIYNAEQLYELHGYWSHRDDWKSNVWYSLEADIDLTEWIEEHSPEEGWRPIGTEDSYFGGHFNGNGHTISGLRIDRPNSDNVGLFGCVDGECSIRDVRLLGAEINGRNNVGGIVGQILCEHSYYPSNEIDLVLCTVEESSINGVQSVGGIVGGVASGEITGIIWCTSENCQISGDKYVGGIAGAAADYSSMTSSTDIAISRCISRCKISGGEYTGGIIGYAYIGLYAGGGIEGCVSECRIEATRYIGGIAGCVGGSFTIDQCYSDVRLTGDMYSNGIVGLVKRSVQKIRIENSYATGRINGRNSLVSIAGKDTIYVMTSCYHIDSDGDVHVMETSDKLAYQKKQATYEKLGWDFDKTWSIQENVSFPYLQMQTAPAYISGPLKVGDTEISGQYTEGGIVRVCAGDSVYTAVSNGNRWTVTVDALQIGDVVSVSVQAEGKMPSYAEYAVVEFVGSGTIDDPYLVRTADELQAVQRMRNDSAVYLMTNDIDLTEWINENDSINGWLPIGKGYKPFSGTFDGGGHTVSGLWGEINNEWFGLFEKCAAVSTVENLNVEIAPDKYVFSGEYNGGIAGCNDGLIKHCSVKGKYIGF